MNPLSILYAILIFGLLIFIHELGHFIVARLCGVKVLEFAIGMGPKLFSWKGKKKGTVYSLRAFPIGGFVNMLTAAKDAGVKRFIYASSSSVYGDCTDSPKFESRTGTPLSPYALTKSVNEQFAMNFSQVYGMECIGLRYFNVFGRRQDPNGAYAAVIPKFSAALLTHTAPVINGDGSYSRDFTYIDDVVQANIRALNTGNADAVNTVYNVACGDETTLNELFAYLKAELSRFDRDISQIEAEHGPVRAGDIPHSKADISRISALLGYKPEYSVKTGLQQTAKWYFENLTAI